MLSHEDSLFSVLGSTLKPMWPTDFLYPTSAEHIVPFFGQSVPFAADGNDEPAAQPRRSTLTLIVEMKNFTMFVFCFVFLFADSQIFKGGAPRARPLITQPAASAGS